MIDIDNLRFNSGLPSLLGSPKSSEAYSADVDRFLEAQIFNLALERDSFDYTVNSFIAGPGRSKTPGIQNLPSTDHTPWMEIAKNEIGISEAAGARNNPRIGEYLRVVGMAPKDEIPWCSAFVNWCIESAGLAPTRNALARSWLNWGVPTNPQYGAIVILRRGQSSTSGHVGFFVSGDGNNITLLGGNQGDRVKLSTYSVYDVLGYRWPN